MGTKHLSAGACHPRIDSVQSSLRPDNPNKINIDRKRGRVPFAAVGVKGGKRCEPGGGEPAVNPSLNHFLEQLAYELRNPLAPIHNAIEVLRLTQPQEPATQRQEDIIERQIATLATLVDHLLDASRLTSGTLEFRKKPLQLQEVLARAVERVAPLIQARRHQFEFRPPEDGLSVNGNLERLAQAVGNLLANSAQYTPDGGCIRLEVWREGPEAVIRVSDNGIGISAEAMPRIFDLFTRLESAGRAKGGLGIGLALARTLVRLHGGEIQADSDGPGRGSRFTIRLPLLPGKPQEATRKAISRKEPAPVPGRRVLVVDDMVDSAATLADLISMWGCDVRVANNGPTALEIARQFKPEAVLLDIGMPGMDGYEVARRLREEHGKKMLLIAQTGYGHPEDRNRTAQAGFDEHLVKPVEIETLSALLGVTMN